MTLVPLNHTFVSTAEDDDNPEHVQGTHWNAQHTIADIDAFKTAIGLAAIATSGDAADLTGTIPGGSLPNLTGDVTSSGSATTIANNAVTSGKIASAAVTNAKLANMAAATLKGNNTGGSTAPSDLGISQVKTLLAYTPSDISGLATIATSGSAADLSSGTIPSARLPAHTGDVTSSAGSAALTIANDAVTNAKLANMAANSFKGNNTASPADPIDLTVAQAKSLLAFSTSDISGLAAIATSGSAADLSTGTIPSARMPAFTGDVTTSAGSVSTTIANDAVTNSKLANMAANTIKGNNTGSTADPTDLSISQLLALLNIKLGEFGDGSDGTVTMDGSTSVAGCSLAGSTYTATRTCFFANLTINSGITFKPDGWPIFVSGTTTNNGDINANGGDASGTTDGTTAVASGRLLPPNMSLGNTSTNAPQVFVAASAANGGASVGGAGSNGLAGTAGTKGRGGGGGSGGNNNPFTAQGGAGGDGPGVTLSSALQGDARVKRYATEGKNNAGTQFTPGTAGGGGGTGGSGTSTGGRGAAGGWLVFQTLAWAGTGTWRAKGGNGGNGTAGGAGIGGAGGGGGGAGGYFVLVLGGGSPPTIDVSGGSGGSGGAGGSGPAGNGGNGAAGGSGHALVL